jgi:protease IV
MRRPSSLLVHAIVWVLLCLGVNGARAQAPTTLLFGNESVASGDNANGWLVNPATVGLRYPSELLLSVADLDPGTTRAAGLGNAGGFGLGFVNEKDGLTSILTGLAGGDEDLRAGLTYTWLRSQPTGDRAGDLRLGTLTRPTPWLSLGATADHVAQPSLDGVLLRRDYTLGLGLRPLALDRGRAHSLGTRLTLTADARLREDESAKESLVRFGGELEVIPGLALRGSIESGGGGAQLGFALFAPRASYHAHAAYDRDGDRQVTTHSLSLHAGEDTPALLGMGVRRVAALRLGGVLSDENAGGFSLFGDESATASWPIHEELERALEDPLTRGVLLELRGVGNFAQIEELRPRIARLRAAGKPVVAYLPYGATRGDLYLAGACDRIVTSDEASFAGLGLRVEHRYYRKLLANLGVRVDRTAYGKFKSFYRTLSADSTPPADREETERILDVVQDQFVSALARDRSMERARLLTLLDGRSWSAREVQKAGLVDSIGDRSDATRLLGELTHLGRRPHAVDLSDAPRARRTWRVPTPIAVVYASGDMEAGRSGADLLNGPTLGSETVVDQLRDAFEDRNVRAVVLRIESGGGLAVAANLMHRAAVRLKHDTDKPLIVSMGRVAASGGYQLAVAGDRIYADRFTYTGSIGVVLLKPSFEEFYARHGVRQDAFQRGRYMRGWSQGEDWDRELQAIADSATYDSYRRFVDKVAAGRGMTFAAVDSIAQGRVWMGEDARARGLVDEIGGLEAAVAEARRRGGVPADEKIELLRYGRPEPSLLQRVVGSAVGSVWRPELHLPEPGDIYYRDDAEEAP